MQTYHDAVLARPDTLLGVCQALGEDLGFNPNILRVALAVPLVWMPVPMFAGYLALGLLVLASRLLFPNPRRAAPVAEAAGVAPPAERQPAVSEPALEELRMAA
jgi:phage shock protein PspC (stress-responsive transcriptional regulator)